MILYLCCTPGKYWVVFKAFDRIIYLLTVPNAGLRPLFTCESCLIMIICVSGSTGKPKGVVHTTAGYMLYAAATFRYVFDYRDKDIYWCTADVGWITGHTYVVYAPMANGATSVMVRFIISKKYLRCK